MKADGFLNALGKGDDEEEDVPRKRRPRKTAEAAPPAADPAPAAADEPAPAPVEAPSAPPAPAADPAPPLTPSQQRAAERREVIEPDALGTLPPHLAALLQTVQDALLPDGPGPASDEPVHKTSVDLRWTLKKGLADLVTRDRRGPKAELNDALELWLHIKGIDVPKWNG